MEFVFSSSVLNTLVMLAGYLTSGVSFCIFSAIFVLSSFLVNSFKIILRKVVLTKLYMLKSGIHRKGI